MDGTPPVRGMGVAAEHVDEARLGQRAHARRGPLAQEEVGRRLDQGTVADQTGDPVEHVSGEVALGMGDQSAVTALGELPDAANQAVAERAGRRLQQDPVAAAERDLGQLLLAQALDRGRRDLAAAQHGERDALLAQPSVDRRDAIGHLVDADVVIVADVGRGADRLDPVDRRLPRHPGAVADVERPVVDAGQDVAVKVDQRATPLSAVVARRHRATMTGMIQHLPRWACGGGWLQLT